MRYRLLAVFLAYLFSSFGLLLMVHMATVELTRPTLTSAAILPLVWGLAWAFHIAMSIGWIVNRRLPRVVPIAGTLIGILGLLVGPFRGLFTFTQFFGQDVATMTVLRLLSYEVLLILPCLLLAVVLVRFHLSGHSRTAND
jgi:hypothetical protein